MCCNKNLGGGLMVDFLNISLFEKLINSTLVQNAPNPMMLTNVLCVLRCVMLWPLAHLFYRISLNCIYFIDRHKANRDGLRTRVIKTSCFEDKWRYYDECRDVIHGFDRSLVYECSQCNGCMAGETRCKNIKFNDSSVRMHYEIWYNMSLILAFLICNPLILFRIVDFRQACGLIVFSVFINPLFVRISYGLSNLNNNDRTSVYFIKKNHENPFKNMFLEMFDNGAWDRYWNSVPESCKNVNPNAAYTTVDTKSFWDDANAARESYARTIDNQRILQQTPTYVWYAGRWWW